ncbi:MAG: hypothetical protein MJ189_01400, partial [Coriobacteriales bacterium]|nr:hypothetical protein [Coriobacteriales bacterium]
MKKTNSQRRKIIENKIDDALSQGFISIIFMLLLASVVVIIIATLCYLVIDFTTDINIAKSLWTAFSFVLNPEPPRYDDLHETIPYLLVTVVVILLGLFLTSALIGIITTALTSRFESLKRGFSPVLEQNHIVIIGFQDNVATFLNEFTLAHEKGEEISILFIDRNLSRADMERTIATILGVSIRKTRKVGNCKVLCRSANTRDIDELQRCAVENSRAVIINEYEDELILKTLLAVTSLLRKTKPNASIDDIPTIVCTFRENEFARAATHVGFEKNIRILFLL